MPYTKRTLPENIKEILPDHAQDIFVEAFNSAFEQYEDPDDRRGNQSRETVARKIAWSAVKNKYEKGDDDKWHKKE